MRNFWVKNWHRLSNEEIHWLYVKGIISFLEAAFGPEQEIG